MRRGTLFIVSMGDDGPCLIDVVQDMGKRLASLGRSLPYAVRLWFEEEGDYDVMRKRAHAARILLMSTKTDGGDHWFDVTPDRAKSMLTGVIETRRKGDPGAILTGEALRPKKRVSVDFAGTAGEKGPKKTKNG